MPHKKAIPGDDADVAASELETLRHEVSAEVRKTCADLMRNADEMKLHDRESSLLKEALAGALAEYSTGKVPQSDVLRAQMALTRMNEHLIELDEERDTARAQLNALRGVSPDEPVEIQGIYASPSELPAIEELERTAIENRPEPAALRKQDAFHAAFPVRHGLQPQAHFAIRQAVRKLHAERVGIAGGDGPHPGADGLRARGFPAAQAHQQTLITRISLQAFDLAAGIHLDRHRKPGALIGLLRRLVTGDAAAPRLSDREAGHRP